jgi:hypothetical protein
MDPEECSRTGRWPKIKVEQRGRKAVFLNPEKKSFTKTVVDGCLIKEELAADFLVSDATVGDLIVELKGRDVKHAVRQVAATAIHIRESGLRKGPRLAALIVCSQYPKFDTPVRRARETFKQEHGAPLRVASGNREYPFQAMFA